MPRRFVRRYIPSQERIRNHRFLRLFGALLHDPNLWHLNRRSVSGAFFVGLFWAFMPVPSQMLTAAATAIGCRVNLPVSVGLVWVTNPVTIPPVFYFAYLVGARLLGHRPQLVHFELTLDSLTRNLGSIWEPLLLGCLICGLFFGALGYGTVRLLWRWQVIRHLKRRRDRRSALEGKAADRYP
ncbi:MAG: DUF2062 domain-containing protein [Chromatiales bacterium]|jgi:uncharacterized protein (DUF2062 family)